MRNPNLHMDDVLFAELLESVREGGAILRGERQASRTFVINDGHEAQEEATTSAEAPQALA